MSARKTAVETLAEYHVASFSDTLRDIVRKQVRHAFGQSQGL